MTLVPLEDDVSGGSVDPVFDDGRGAMVRTAAVVIACAAVVIVAAGAAVGLGLGHRISREVDATTLAPPEAPRPIRRPEPAPTA
ncbi:MAG: hypothetical protein ABMB14_33370, partial [Myxococcota bacterium]